MKKTVCHITSVHPPTDIRIFYKECLSLAKAGYQVQLIAPLNQPIFLEGVKIIPIRLPKPRIFRMLLVSFLMWFKAVSVNAKVYHFHDPELLLCGVLLKISGKKVIFDIHENVRLSFQSKDWLPKWSVKFIRFFYFIFERCCIPFFDHLILAEESYANYYPKKKSTVVLNFPLPTTIEVPDKKYKSPIRFIYSGVVHPLRGIWEMLDLIKRMDQSGVAVTLDLVGEVRPENLNSDIQVYLNKHQLAGKVFIHGKVDFKKVSSFLVNADIGLALLQPVPNYKESLPTKIFEYMQHRLPVITNNFDLYKKYVEVPECGICENIENPEILFEKVVALVQLPEELKRMGENGWNSVTNFFTWESQEQKLLVVYNTLFQTKRNLWE